MPFKPTILLPPKRPQEVREYAKRIQKKEGSKYEINSEQEQAEIMPDVQYRVEDAATIKTFIEDKFDGEVTNEREVGVVGAMSQVYFIHREDKPDLVIKTERTYKNPENEQRLSTWELAKSRSQKRESFDHEQDISSRRQVHLDVKQRLNQAGIQTAEYVGSVVIPGFDRETQLSIDAAGLEETRVAMGKDFREIPIYTEVWENPGGVDIEDAEDQVEAMYATPEGRAELVTVADSLLNLAAEGFVFDATAGAFPYGEEPLFTENEGLPYPKNFVITENNTLTCIDFNMGLDLQKEGIWDPTLLQDHEDGILKRSQDGQLYYNWELEQAYGEKLRKLKKEDLNRISNSVNDSNGEQVAQEYLDAIYYWKRMSHEMDRLFAMVKLGNQIKKECEAKETGN